LHRTKNLLREQKTGVPANDVKSSLIEFLRQFLATNIAQFLKMMTNSDDFPKRKVITRLLNSAN
jgi:hypothetical protein